MDIVFVYFGKPFINVRVRPSLAYMQNLLSSLKTTERHPTVQSNVHDTRVAVLGGVVV